MLSIFAIAAGTLIAQLEMGKKEMEKSLLATSEALYSKARHAERAADRSTRSTAVGFRLQRDRYIAAVSDLRREKAVQETVHRYTTEKGGRLDREKNHWFSHGQLFLLCTQRTFT